MARNTLAGKRTGKSKTAKHYAKNAKSRRKKKKYDSEYHATPSRKKYRAKLNKENKKRGTYGNKDKKDVSHTKRGKTVLERQSKNRARNRSKK
jgi:hypothetical protein|tara:strand:- start:561 stop:839 length:279 start_codon:yes stop_codon:yes gene_type:complete